MAGAAGSIDIPDAGPTTSEALMTCSAEFADWLAAQNIALALTTYQAGRLFFVGRKPDGGIRAHERMIENCQGLWSDGQSLWTSSAYMLWRFENVLAAGETTASGADRKFVPVEGRVTGQIDCHDIAMAEVDGAPRPIFVNTRCNCLATISEHHSFRPLWRPPFISALVAEDRCHLNGLATEGLRPVYVTAVGRADVADGWRDQRQTGGVVVEVGSGEIVAAGLSMPHSPRLYRGRLWLLNSGTGEFGHVDPGDGRFTPLCFCPGFARGLAFIGDYAVIGLSLQRREGSFSGLPLDRALDGKSAMARCGLLVGNLTTGATEHWLRFGHTITELYDIAILPATRMAEATGFRNDDIRQHLTSEPWPPAGQHETLSPMNREY